MLEISFLAQVETFKYLGVLHENEGKIIWQIVGELECCSDSSACCDEERAEPEGEVFNISVVSCNLHQWSKTIRNTQKGHNKYK